MLTIMNGLTPFDGVLVGGQPTREQLQQAQAAGFEPSLIFGVLAKLVRT